MNTAIIISLVCLLINNNKWVFATTPMNPPTPNPTSTSENNRVILYLPTSCSSKLCNLNSIIMDNYQTICSTRLPTPFDSCGQHSNNKNVIFKIYLDEYLVDTYTKTYFISTFTNTVTTYTYMNMLMDLKLRPYVLACLDSIGNIYVYKNIVVKHFGVNTRSSANPPHYLFTSVELYIDTNIAPGPGP